MRTYLNFLAGLERGEFAPVYLFHGEEGYLRRHAVQELQRRILSAENDQFNFDLIDGEETMIETVVSLAESPPFLADRRLVLVRYAPYFTAKVKKKPALQTTSGLKEGEAEGMSSPGDILLLKYLSNPFLSTCLVFDVSQAVDRRKKLYKAIQKSGRAIEFSHLKPEELLKWLNSRVNREGKKATSGSLELMINRVGRSMILLENELQKVISYVGEKKNITREDVNDVTIPLIEESIFKVMDAFVERQAEEALTGIRDLLEKNNPPPVILSMVARQFRLILQAQELIGAGCQPAELSRRLDVPHFVARKLSAQSHNFSFEQLKQILNRLLELDTGTKNGSLDFYPSMEMLILDLCCSPENFLVF